MIYLALTVFSPVLLFLIFKEYGKRNIDRIQAITFNYLSIYYLLLAIEQIETSLVFPLLNIGVVALSFVIGVITYKEHLTKTNITGVIIPIFAIILLMNS